MSHTRKAVCQATKQAIDRAGRQARQHQGSTAEERVTDRQAQKERTREALLAAALRLLEDQNLSSLGLREVTRAAGISPAAFYRHFRDMSDLGVALVEESLGRLHELVRRILAEQHDPEERIDRSVDLIAQLVREFPAHIRFMARERYGGVRAVRTAIAAELDRFAREVAEGLEAETAVAAGWSPTDLRMLAELYVDHMMMTASALQEAIHGTGRDEEAILRTARSQLRLINLGRRHYGKRPRSDG